MKSFKLLSIAIISFILSTSINAQDVISVNDLAAKLKDKSTVIVDCRKESAYKKRHIKNAINIYHGKCYNDGPVKSMIQSPAKLAKTFGKAGINTDKSIVLYDNGSGKYAGRVYWILKYLGVKDVKVLNGHIKAWQAGRKPVTMAATMAKKTTFTPQIKAKYLASLNDVKASIKSGVVLLDVRAATEFNGTNESDLRKGHIPTAKNIEFKNVLTARGELKSKAELKTLFESAGITSDKEIILYCATSVRAGIVFLALHSALEYPNVKVYDGAFYEWEADTKNEVVK